MKSSVLSASLLMAGSVLAAPVEKRQYTNIDTTVLQFALTLEHLENVFYKQALQKFSQAQFAAAGYSTYYNNLQYIAADEQSHVELLSSALKSAGVTPNAACTYNFAYTDVKSFITLSSVLEGVGVSAYLGAAPLVTSKDYLTVAGSILVTESLHTSYQRASIGEVPFATPYGTPLDPTSVYTLAAAFISSCPASNAPLPFKPFPALTGPSSMCSSGTAYKFTTTASLPSTPYVTFVSGLTVTSVKATSWGSGYVEAMIPSNMVGGQVYVFLTNTDVEMKLSDSAVVAGPGIIEVAALAPMIDYSESK